MSAKDVVDELDQYMLELNSSINGLPYASADTEDKDTQKNAFVEGVFLRGFTAFENALERLFLLYCVGKVGLDGSLPECRLTGCSEAQAFAIAKNGQKYLDWSNTRSVRDRAELFFKDGEPFRSAVDPRSAHLSEMEKIRNRIAHCSTEAKVAYADVQLRAFQTPRVFEMSPGQFLRTRRRGRPTVSHCVHYLSNMHDVVHSVALKRTAPKPAAAA